MNEVINHTREIRKREYMLCCPYCGKFQYRIWGEGGIAFQCERCKSGFEATFMEGQITMRDREEEARSEMPKMRAKVRVAY